MNINLDPSKLTGFSKTMVAVIGAATAAWQVPQVHDLIISLLTSHPQLSSLVGAGVTIWGVLHNPVKPIGS